MMSFKAAGVIGSIMALVALIMVFIKQLITFVGLLTFVIKAIVFLAFLTVFIGVGVLVFKAWKDNQKRKNHV